MNIPLLKMTVKQNYIIWLIFMGIMAMYFTMIVYMFSPEDMSALVGTMDMLPKEMISAFGFADTPSDLTGFISSFFYGFLVFAFPMVYCVIIGNKLVAKTVDGGSFAYLLTTANSRSKIITTRAVFLISSILLMFAILFVVGVATCESMFPGLLDITAFFYINLSAMLVVMFVSMICFFFSCMFNDTKYSLSFGAGIPIFFFLMFMIGGVSDKASLIKDMSIFSLLDAKAIAAGESSLGANMICITACIAIFGLSLLVFNKKRLPL